MNADEYHKFLMIEVSSIFGSIIFITIFLYLVFVCMREESDMDDISECGSDDNSFRIRSNTVKVRFSEISQPYPEYDGFRHTP